MYTTNNRFFASFSTIQFSYGLLYCVPLFVYLAVCFVLAVVVFLSVYSYKSSHRAVAAVYSLLRNSFFSSLAVAVVVCAKRN